MKKSERIADLIKNRFGLVTSAGEDMQGFDELANILNHRTHRRYLDKPVPDELLEVLLGAAFSAPAKSDLQQASVVVIRDKDKQEAIADMIPAMPCLRTCPVLMVFLGDSRRIRRIDLPVFREVSGLCSPRRDSDIQVHSGTVRRF